MSTLTTDSDRRGKPLLRTQQVTPDSSDQIISERRRQNVVGLEIGNAHL